MNPDQIMALLKRLSSAVDALQDTGDTLMRIAAEIPNDFAEATLTFAAENTMHASSKTLLVANALKGVLDDSIALEAVDVVLKHDATASHAEVVDLQSELAKREGLD